MNLKGWLNRLKVRKRVSLLRAWPAAWHPIGYPLTNNMYPAIHAILNTQIINIVHFILKNFIAFYGRYLPVQRVWPVVGVSPVIYNIKQLYRYVFYKTKSFWLNFCLKSLTETSANITGIDACLFLKCHFVRLAFFRSAPFGISSNCDVLAGQN